VLDLAMAPSPPLSCQGLRREEIDRIGWGSPLRGAGIIFWNWNRESVTGS
jgi:hypothetical protein